MGRRPSPQHANHPDFDVVEGKRNFDVPVLHERPSRAAFDRWHQSEAHRPWRDLRQQRAAAWVSAYILPWISIE